jgi:predicted dehydrogenase
MAAQLDGQIRFSAGALSSTPDRALASGREVGLADDRNYPTWQDMLAGELERPEDPDGSNPGGRIDLISIVTPNHMHYEPARAFAEAGISIVLDKPMVIETAHADDLVATVEQTGTVFAVTYNYTGYPLIKQAAALVRAGAIGDIRRVIVEYLQGWLSTKLEDTGQKQAGWRTNPRMAGAGAVGDIGSHAENLISTVTGLSIESLCADVHTFIPGRTIDDDASVLLRLSGGARGTLQCSQIAIGEENNLRLRIYGTQGALHWNQENPNELVYQPEGRAKQIITRATPGSAAAPGGDAAARGTRIPSGHPEGFIEAFANIYRGVAEAIRAKRAGRMPEGLGLEFPTVRDGARGVRFIHKVLESSAAGGVWVTMD